MIRKLLIMYNRIMIIVLGVVLMLSCFQDGHNFLGCFIFLLCLKLSQIKISEENENNE